MSRKVTVRVNRHLINWALQQTSTQCAISLALKDADDNITHPRVTQGTIAFRDASTNTRYVFNTPEKIANWIDNFDRDPSTTKPLTFTLDLDEADKMVPIKRLQPSQTIAHHQEYEANKGNVSRARKPEQASSNIYRPLRTV
jgi:hypothetical protein